MLNCGSFFFAMSEYKIQFNLHANSNIFLCAFAKRERNGGLAEYICFYQQWLANAHCVLTAQSAHTIRIEEELNLKF